jgi:GcrA cell cycle regulator
MNAIVPLSLMLPAASKVSWTDEAIETVIRLSADGRSATEIANAMREEHPGITRNAVIGKLHRLGCAGGGRQSNKDKSDLGPIRFRALRPTAPAPRVGRGVRKRSERIERHVERAAAPVLASEWITIVDLNESVCHFPRGTPGRDDFAYCGASIKEGERYCGAHRRVMFSSAPLKRL